MNLSSPSLAHLLLAASLLGLAAGCSGFPDVTYDERMDTVTAGDAAAGEPETPVTPGLTPGVDASVDMDAAGPNEPAQPDAGPGPGPACSKNACVGNACAAPGTCDRCKDACKGQTKKCCANADPANPAALALSCVADHARCPGETP